MTNLFNRTITMHGGLHGEGNSAPLINMKVSELLPSWRENKPIAIDTNFGVLVRDGWRKNELIFACSSKKSNTASQVRLKVVRKRDGQELKDHALKKLLSSPNPRMSLFDVVSSISIFQDFAGVAYYEKIRSKAGIVVQLYPMRPDWVQPKANSQKFIAQYEYGPPGQEPKIIDADNVMSFPLWDPINFYRGYPPVAVAARTGDLDNAVTDYLRLLFQEGGVPPGLLKTKQAIDDAVAENMRQKWRERYGGSRNWLDPAVLGYDLEYQQVGIGVDKMGLEILDKRNETRICMVMKVPPMLISTQIGLERAIKSNAQEYQRDWWINDLIPMYTSWLDTFNNQLAPDFGDDVMLQWDFSEVLALTEIIKEKHKSALEDLKAGAITRNQYYERVGLPTLGARGEVFLMPLSVVEVPTSKMKLQQTPTANPSKPADDEGKVHPLDLIEAKVNSAPDDDERKEAEALVKGALEKALEKEMKDIASALSVKL